MHLQSLPGMQEFFESCNKDSFPQTGITALGGSNPKHNSQGPPLLLATDSGDRHARHLNRPRKRLNGEQVENSFWHALDQTKDHTGNAS